MQSDSANLADIPTDTQNGNTFRLSVNGSFDISAPRSGEALLKNLLDPMGPLSAREREDLLKSLESDSFKTAVLVQDFSHDSDTEVRFFDSVELARFLWVRVTLRDGQVVEGQLRNRLDAFTSRFVVIYPLDSNSGMKCILISHAALDNIQVISTRN